MIIILQLPDQEVELQGWVANPIPKHIWHDVPTNKIYIYTEQDCLDQLGEQE
jgi:hypothetical protein